jgi:hypothetical protein
MVELAVTPDRRWTATTAELLAATAAARFSALGAFADRAGPDVRQLYDAALVRCHEVLALVVSDDEGERPSDLRRRSPTPPQSWAPSGC